MDDVHQLNEGVDERDFFDEDGNNLYGNDTDKADDEWKVGEYNPLAVHLLLTTPYTQWMWDGQSHKQC